MAVSQKRLLATPKCFAHTKLECHPDVFPSRASAFAKPSPIDQEARAFGTTAAVAALGTQSVCGG
eukprot:m.488413 g.488413  ORF g.488413 m.488413 type:complete len:65 (-) comp87948_c0_seq1:52-246(-)